MKRYFVVIQVFVFLASICLVLGPALAQDEFQQRIQRQQDRINQGVQSGALTKDEKSILQGNLDHIRDAYARKKADGKLTPQEQKRLDNMLDENSKMIRQQKQDSDVKGQPAQPSINIRKLF